MIAIYSGERGGVDQQNEKREPIVMSQMDSGY